MEMFTFTSKKGREYVLDNSTNMVFPRSWVAKRETVCMKDGLRICQIKELSEHANTWKAKFGCFSDRNMNINMGEREEIFSEYKEYIGLLGREVADFLQLTLIVTEDCNLECKYCIYSGIYKYERVRNKKSMPFLVARKSIDYFMTEHFSRIRRINPIVRPSIGFYGGEPLLEFDLITKIRKYCSDKYPNLDIIWNLTTNGTLLSGEVTRFLVENDFLVSISLDGPEEEHDRNRVYKGGKGSFAEVLEGVIRLKEESKNARKEGILPYSIATCFDRRTNLEKVNDFFVNNVEILGMIGRVSSVKPHFTSYYDNVAPAEEEEFFNRYRILQERHFDAIRNNRLGVKETFLERFLTDPLRTKYDRPISCDGRHLTPLLGGCIPGGKIAVDCDGNFHVCEKMNHNFPIGNYMEGIDILKVRKIIQKWKEATKKCIHCPISGLCGICYATCCADDKFDIEEVCLDSKNDLAESLVAVYSLLEENARSFEQVRLFRDKLKEEIEKYDDLMKLEY